MPDNLTSSSSRWILTCALLLGLAVPGTAALAQTPPGAPPPPPGAQANPICVRLEGQLATIARGGASGDPAKDEQIRRYQDRKSTRLNSSHRP